MHNDTVLLVIQFRETAFPLFETRCTEFAAQVKRLDRQTDENVFQQLLGRHAQQLQQQLDLAARALLRYHRGDDMPQLQQWLMHYIAYCCAEFRIKAGGY